MRRTAVIPIIIILFAAAIRLPYLYDIPPFGGANENVIALDILQGRHSLINQYPHIGSLSPYLVAGFLAVLGHHWYVVRLVPFLFGLLTVLLTFLLGKDLFDRSTGCLAAIFMSVAFYHVVFTSHFPWSNNLTPFFTTAFLFSLHHLMRAPNRSNGVLWSIPCGLSYGLGLQSHPEVSVLFPVIPLAFILSEKHLFRWLMRPSFFTLGFFALVGYANMIYYNIASRMQSVSFGLTYPQYALVERYTPAAILTNHGRATLHLARMYLGFPDDTLSWIHYAQHPAILFFWVAVITGLVFAFRRRILLVPLAFLSALILIPLANRTYNFALGRYLVFLFPLASILIALAMTTIADHARSISKKLLRVSAVSLVLSALVFFIVFPINGIRTYYAEQIRLGETSRPYWNLKTIADTYRNRSSLIFVDDALPWGFNMTQFLREDGFQARLLYWDDPRKPPFDDLKFHSQIAAAFKARPDRAVLAILHEENVPSFLNRVPVARIGANFDFTTVSGWQNMARVLEIGGPKDTAWLNAALIPARLAESGRLIFQDRGGYWALPSGHPLRFPPRITADPHSSSASIIWDAGERIACTTMKATVAGTDYIDPGDPDDAPPAIARDDTGDPLVLFISRWSDRRQIVRARPASVFGPYPRLSTVTDLPDTAGRSIATAIGPGPIYPASVLTEHSLVLIDSLVSASPEIRFIDTPVEGIPAAQDTTCQIGTDGAVDIAFPDCSGVLHCRFDAMGWQITRHDIPDPDRIVFDASGNPLAINFEDTVRIDIDPTREPQTIYRTETRSFSAVALDAPSDRTGVAIRSNNRPVLALQEPSGRIRFLETARTIRATPKRIGFGQIRQTAVNVLQTTITIDNPDRETLWDVYVGTVCSDGSVRYFPDWTPTPHPMRTTIPIGRSLPEDLAIDIRLEPGQIPCQLFAFAALPGTLYPVADGERLVITFGASSAPPVSTELQE